MSMRSMVSSLLFVISTVVIGCNHSKVLDTIEPAKKIAKNLAWLENLGNLKAFTPIAPDPRIDPDWETTPT